MSLIQDHLLLNPKFQKYAFKMDQLAVALYLDLLVHINDAVDMLSVTTEHSRQSLAALVDAMGGEAILHKKNVQSLFFDASESPTVDAATGVALEAWAACRAATLPHMSSRFAFLPRINTNAFPEAHLTALASISRHTDRLEALKPTIVAESTRQDIVLKALQHNTNILLNPFFRAVWLPKERRMWSQSEKKREAPPVYFPRVLNNSQHAAVRRILSGKSDDRIIVIHGPPGTGKTTVIAASVISHHHAKSGQNIWVAAQSNVAVKNIVEMFIKEGFHEFKVLVSKDFHYDGREHLYEELEPCLIRSDTFKMSTVEASRQLLDCNVILCTLSMFSNPNIDVFLRIVPVETIILDEANQIECGDYLPIFHHFHSTLSKLVFIGDDKQCDLSLLAHVS
ncbi:P-loop containing nucleoside triphosphate hydrolase protein [Boletus coccyginus]|nr:P-loop containing nucleoside triphosphate hydrolase protein [Boletus coccyginus]